jgi:short-subunit dehydrogenase
MAKRKSGRIVFVLTSALEDAPPAYMSAYLSAKHALWGLAKGVEAEVAGRGVSVRCAFPGMTKTDFIKDFPRPIVDEASPIEPSAVARSVLRLLGEEK